MQRKRDKDRKSFFLDLLLVGPRKVMDSFLFIYVQSILHRGNKMISISISSPLCHNGPKWPGYNFKKVDSDISCVIAILLQNRFLFFFTSGAEVIMHNYKVVKT